MYLSTALNKRIASVKDISISRYSGGIENHQILDDLYKFTELESLWLSDDFKEISPKIANFKKLTRLSIDSDMLISLPKEIGELENLRYLSICCKFMQELPEEIAKLKNLERFNILRSPELGSLPKALAQLPKLKEINYHFDCKLTGRPPSTSNDR